MLWLPALTLFWFPWLTWPCSTGTARLCDLDPNGDRKAWLGVFILQLLHPWPSESSSLTHWLSGLGSRHPERKDQTFASACYEWGTHYSFQQISLCYHHQSRFIEGETGAEEAKVHSVGEAEVWTQWCEFSPCSNSWHPIGLVIHATLSLETFP